MAKKQTRKSRTPYSWRTDPTREVHFGGIVTALVTSMAVLASPALASAAATTTTTPSVVTPATPFRLVSSSNELKPIIDEIVSAQQYAIAYGISQSYATTGSNATLPDSVQSLLFWNANQLLSQYSAANPFNNGLQETLAGNASESRLYFGAFNPPNTLYTMAVLDPNATYVITGKPGAGTLDLNINPYELGLTNRVSSTVGLEIGHNLVLNPDGTYTVYMGPTAPPGAVNYVKNTGFNSLLIRDSLGNLALGGGGGSVNVECVADCPAPTPGVNSVGLSKDKIAELLQTLADTTVASNKLWLDTFAKPAHQFGAPNHFTPIIPTRDLEDVGGGTLPTQAITVASYSLAPDQALIVKLPDLGTAWSSIELLNAFSVNQPYVQTQSSMNNTQSYKAADGYTYYVISATNPGVANWIDSSNFSDGVVLFRYQNFPADIPSMTPVTSQVVSVADVQSHLPADTPTVTPEQYAAALKQRVFSYGYALDATKNTGWITQNLMLDDLQNAMGVDNYNTVFGAQPGTPVLQRLLSPSLNPDWAAVATAMLTDPMGSLTAMVNALPVAFNELSLPAALAVVRLAKVVAQTVQSVATAVHSGQSLQALTAVATGMGDLAGVLNKTFTDPTTGIPAGLLNARDDIAAAVAYGRTSGATLSGLTQAVSGAAQSILSETLKAGSFLNQAAADVRTWAATDQAGAPASSATQPTAAHSVSAASSETGTSTGTSTGTGTPPSSTGTATSHSSAGTESRTSTGMSGSARTGNGASGSGNGTSGSTGADTDSKPSTGTNSKPSAGTGRRASTGTSGNGSGASGSSHGSGE